MIGWRSTSFTSPDPLCPCVFVQVPHEQLTCTTPPGAGRGHRWVVRVGGQDSFPSDHVFSYAPPTITALWVVRSAGAELVGDVATLSFVAPTALDTRGGTIRVVGFNFAAESGLVALAGTPYLTKALSTTPFGVVPCDDTPVYDPTGAVDNTTLPWPASAAYCVDIDVPEGDGRNRGVQLVVGEQSSVTLQYSFSDPHLDDLVVQEDQGVAKLMVLRGSNFGLHGQVWVAVANSTTASASSPSATDTIDELSAADVLSMAAAGDG